MTKDDVKMTPSKRSNQTFTLYPAIDILGGACVRLFKGDYDASTTYEADPRKVAGRWLSQGGQFLHVVDLDAAKSGSLTNHAVIGDMVKQAAEAGASVQVGGGIRDEETVARWLDLGVARCVMGTAALDTALMERLVKRFSSDALVVGLDGRAGKLAVRGWVEQTDVSLVDVANRLSDLGIRHALVTDVERDGTLQGPNLGLATEIAKTGMNAIASGGLRNLEDVLAARDAGLAGAIAGRSLYDGTLDLRAALDAVASAG